MALLRREQLAGVNLHYRLFPLESFFRSQQALGIKSVELWAGAPHFLLGCDGVQDCAGLKAQAESFGLRIPVFSPECVTYPFPLCSGNPEVRRMAHDYYANAIRAAARLGAGVVPLSCAGGLKDEDGEAVFRRAAEALRALAPLAGDQGVTLAVETLCPDASVTVNTLPQLLRLLDEVDSPSVQAALDVCAVRTAGETLEQWFDALGDRIVHIHFTDGRPGGRLVWGRGLHPLDDYLQTLDRRGYRGYLGLNLNVRGTWFDPSLVDEERGFTGTEFVPENYWFTPAEADRKNLEAFAPYLAD